jgi:ABC-2 type transport system permease protein
MRRRDWREARLDDRRPSGGERRWGREPGIARVVRRELARMGSRPLYPLLLLVLPLAGWLVLLAAFGSRTPRDLPVAVVDLDRSALSRQLTRSVDATGTMRVVAAPSTRGGAEDLLLRGEVYAVVVLPEGLDRDVLRRDAPPVVAFYNAQWLLPGKLIARDLAAVVGHVSAGLELRARLASGEGGGARAALEPIRTESHPLFNPELDYAEFLLTALIPALLQIFVLVLTVHALGSELRQRSAGRWLDAAGGSVARALAGKLAPYAVWYVALALGLTAATGRWLGLPVQGSAAVLAAGLVLLVLAVLGVALVLVGWTANLRLATSLASLLAVPAFAFSGITFPVSGMPVAARLWSTMLPLTHYLRVQTQQLVVGSPTRSSLPALAALMALTAALVGASAWRYGRLLREPELWGRT